MSLKASKALFFDSVAEMYIWAFLSANIKTNGNTFEKNKQRQIWVKILAKNVFENTKKNTFNLLYSDLVFCEF